MRQVNPEVLGSSPRRPTFFPVTLHRFIRDAYAAGAVRDAEGNEIALEPHSVEQPDGEALRDLAVAEGATRTIEVGLALGMSALFLCQAVLESGAESPRHVAVDPYQQESWNGAGLVTLREAGVEGVVEVIEEESQLALPDLLRQGQRFDLAFIDGDHRFEGVFLDLVFMARLVRPGGLIVIDDMWMPAVRLAVSYAERNMDLELAPGLLPGAFTWGRRGPLSRGVPSGSGRVAALRTPAEPAPKPWDGFVQFF